jgi:hypothetical protein
MLIGPCESRMRGSMSAAAKALLKIVNSCSYQGHDWQPLIIEGYFQCQRCKKLGHCRICAPNARGIPFSGVCHKHQHLRIPEHQEEVLSHA